MTYRATVLLAFLLWSPATAVVAEQTDIDSLLDKIEARRSSYKEYDSFAASARTTQQMMDGDWKPKKTIIVEKKIARSKTGQTIEILKATNTEKGVTEDITGEYRKKEEERREKEEKKKARSDDDEEDDGGGRHASLSLGDNDIFPFRKAGRARFQITRLPDARLLDKPVLVIQTEARKKSRDVYEGKYYIDPETYDILLIELNPSRNPRFVKELRMKMEFEVLPGNYQVVRTYWMHLFVDAWIKKVRMELEEKYENYSIPAD
jgi:hypothetical protein